MAVPIGLACDSAGARYMRTIADGIDSKFAGFCVSMDTEFCEVISLLSRIGPECDNADHLDCTPSVKHFMLLWLKMAAEQNVVH
ncbi:hypothetical protein AXF42_Ash012431 [Apostasia shenzhenica]|uniref:Uncharacterized protein n=1 Tax=Apostasia shenzhenica TaxID=1088818 RepID=A0A2I0AQR7_9ASPA|nr:hypothetical protein AXF42_Ash012431 [Apostasia shenzhenica]